MDTPCLYIFCSGVDVWGLVGEPLKKIKEQHVIVVLVVMKGYFSSSIYYLPNARFRPFVGERLFVLGVVGGFISPKRNGGRYPTLVLPVGECVGLPRVMGSIAEGSCYVKIRKYVFEKRQTRFSLYFYHLSFYKKTRTYGWFDSKLNSKVCFVETTLTSLVGYTESTREHSILSFILNFIWHGYIYMFCQKNSAKQT